ncbi:hypothetical protein V8E54_014674 [Elaphomyces granulatus]
MVYNEVETILFIIHFYRDSPNSPKKKRDKHKASALSWSEIDEFGSTYPTGSEYKPAPLPASQWRLRTRDRSNKRLWLCQDQYIEKLVTLYHQEYAPLSHTPLSTQNLQKYATPNQITAYQGRVGSIICPASTLRPDIAYAARVHAESLAGPSRRST